MPDEMRTAQNRDRWLRKSFPRRSAAIPSCHRIQLSATGGRGVVRWFIAPFVVSLLALSLGGCPRSEPAPSPPPVAAVDNDGASNHGNNNAGHTAGQSGGESQTPTNSTDNNTPGADASDGETRRRLIELGSGEPKVIKPASEYFAHTYDDAGRELFTRHLHDQDATVRKGALWGALLGATGGFDLANEQQAAAQQAALADDDAGVRHVALEAVNSLNDKSFAEYFDVERIVLFVDDAHEPHADNRALAARMFSRLGLLGTAAQPALPALNAAVRSDPHPDVRTACLHAIYNIARNAEEALPAPTYVLQHDEDPRLRRIAANRLGSYKGASAPAIGQLIAALADLGVPQRTPDDPLRGTDEPVCIAAANALARIGQPAVAPLMESLNSDDREVRILSIRALGDIGPPAKSATEALKRHAQSNSAGEATAAKAALIRIHGP